MKVLVIVALAAVACVCAEEAKKRSVGAYDGWSGVAYHAPAVVSSYTTAHQLPSYYVPESTSITTSSRRLYNVHVPVTYTHTVAEPVVRHTTTYHHAPVYNSYIAPTYARYPAYAYSYAPAYSSW